MIAVSDTCFLIDWARFSLRDCIFSLFNKILIPKQVLDEIASSTTVDFLSNYMARGKLVYYEPTQDLMREADELVRKSIELSYLRRIDLPEAICLTLGKRYGYVVLTENLGAFAITKVDESFKNVRVWRSLEVLIEAYKVKAIKGDIEEILKRYSEETKHIFDDGEVKRMISCLK